jgi:hypothetical protein
VVWIVVLWRGLALEVVAAVFAGTVRDMSVGHRLMVAGCACGFNGSAVAICFTNCGFGCGRGMVVVDVRACGSFRAMWMCVNCIAEFGVSMRADVSGWNHA